MSNIGLKITDFYCNGFAGRRYDLADSIIEAEGKDWIVIRTSEGSPVFMNLEGWDKQEHINEWTNQNKDKKCTCDKPILQSETKQCGKCKMYIDRIEHMLLTEKNKDE